MLILLDLDGTILNTVHPAWKPYKDGLENYTIDKYLDKLPFFDGSRVFIKQQKSNGNSILIVSDSHPRYVEPICKFLECDCVYLADKPNKDKLLAYLESRSHYKNMVQCGDGIFIGDTVLDIELGRRLGLPSVWLQPYQISREIRNDRDKIGDEMGSLKMGPTYVVRSFEELSIVFENPINNLYAIESSFSGGNSAIAIKYQQNWFRDGSFAAVRCLGRQESGMSDKYSRADVYYAISNSNRPKELLTKLATCVSSYLNQTIKANQKWDYITYLTDKETTEPPNKMKEIFDLIETEIPKVQLLKWSDTVEGSIRNNNLYGNRKEFLEKFLQVGTLVQRTHSDENYDFTLNGKNIVIIDDQLTTGATAWHVIHKLKEKGAYNILFIALFQMTLPIESDMVCPRCGKQMLIKIRRRDGKKFYSCNPPQFNGNGCGYIIDIPNQ